MKDPYTTADAMESAVLHRCADLRDDGRDHSVPVPAKVAAKQAKSPAEWAFQRVILQLKAFETALDEDQISAMAFAGGPAGVLRIRGVGFSAPDMVTFSGEDDAGNMTQVLQHVSQINVMLRALPKPADQPVPERIGFRLARALEEAADTEDTAANDVNAAS